MWKVKLQAHGYLFWLFCSAAFVVVVVYCHDWQLARSAWRFAAHPPCDITTLNLAGLDKQLAHQLVVVGGRYFTAPTQYQGGRRRGGGSRSSNAAVPVLLEHLDISHPSPPPTPAHQVYVLAPRNDKIHNDVSHPCKLLHIWLITKTDTNIW